MANLIAAGATELASADFTLAAGVPTTLQINSASASASLPTDARAQIQYKNAAGFYNTLGELNYRTQAMVLNGPGTFRVLRLACAGNVAVDRD